MTLSSAEFVADIKRTFENDLSELQETGIVKARVSKEDKRRILKYLDDNVDSFKEEDGFDLESLIDEHFPHLITQSYRRDMAQLAKGEWKPKTEKRRPGGPLIQIEVSWEFFVWLIIFAVIGTLIWVSMK